MTPHISVLGLLALTVAFATAVTDPPVYEDPPPSRFPACDAVARKSYSVVDIGECVSAFISFEFQPSDSNSCFIKESACGDIIPVLEMREQYIKREYPEYSNYLNQASELLRMMRSYCAKDRSAFNSDPNDKGNNPKRIPNKILQRIVGIKAILRAPHVYDPKKTNEKTVGLAILLAAAVLDHSTTPPQALFKKTDELLNISQKFLNVSTKKESVKVLKRFKKSYPEITEIIINELKQFSKPDPLLRKNVEESGLSSYMYTYLTRANDADRLGSIASLVKMVEDAEVKARKRKSWKRSL